MSADDPLDKLTERSPSKRWKQLKKEYKDRKDAPEDLELEKFSDRQRRKLEHIASRIERKENKGDKRNRKDKDESSQPSYQKNLPIVVLRPSQKHSMPNQFSDDEDLNIETPRILQPKRIQRPQMKIAKIEPEASPFFPETTIEQPDIRKTIIKEKPPVLKEEQVADAMIIPKEEEFVLPKKLEKVKVVFVEPEIVEPEIDEPEVSEVPEPVKVVIEKVVKPKAVVVEAPQPVFKLVEKPVIKKVASVPTLTFPQAVSKSYNLQWQSMDSEPSLLDEVEEVKSELPIVAPQGTIVEPRRFIPSNGSKSSISISPMIKSDASKLFTPVDRWSPQSLIPDDAIQNSNEFSIQMIGFEVEVAQNGTSVPLLPIPPKPTNNLNSELSPEHLLRPITDISPFDDYEPDPVVRQNDPYQNQKSRPDGKSKTDIRYAFPPEIAISDEMYEGRFFAETIFHWDASNIKYNPLYFEDVQLERYGHDHHELIQPIYSLGKFSAQLIGMPYQWVLHSPDEDVYPLGHYQVGEPTPRLVHQVPLNAKAAAVTGAFYTGMFFLIP